MFDFLANKFSAVFNRLAGNNRLTEANMGEALEEVKGALIEADVPLVLVEKFVDSVKKEAVGKKVLASIKPGEQLVKLVHDQLVAFMGGTSTGDFSFPLPAVVLVMGLQGAGKTTSIAKLVHWVQKQAAKKGKKRRILLASVDFYRPAAIDQLSLLAEQVGVSFYRSTVNSPLPAVQEILELYKKERYEMLFLDTAGRLHVDDGMMAELKAINAAISPRYKLLVLDAMTGQESLRVAAAFNDAIGFDGAMLTKIDSDTRGGAAFAFRYALQKPIVFVGSGEKYDDLEEFKPERVAGRILGMGDVLSLVERAQERVNADKQAALEQSLRSGRMTLEDFASQLDMVSSMGSLGALMKYLPGAGGASLSPEMVQKAESEMKQFKAVIHSMTPKERQNTRILDLSRKRRIARGAGVDVKIVDLLLARFEQSQQYVKLLRKFGRF